jgi:hypothetical protein
MKQEPPLSGSGALRDVPSGITGGGCPSIGTPLTGWLRE